MRRVVNSFGCWHSSSGNATAFCDTCPRICRGNSIRLSTRTRRPVRELECVWVMHHPNTSLVEGGEARRVLPTVDARWKGKIFTGSNTGSAIADHHTETDPDAARSRWTGSNRKACQTEIMKASPLADPPKSSHLGERAVMATANENKFSR